MADLILTCQPESDDFAMGEVRRISRTARVAAELGPGVMLIDGLPFRDAADRWRDKPPIFVRHICPVQAAFPLPAAPDLIPALVTAATGDLLAHMTPNVPFSVQARVFGEVTARPFDVNRALSDAIGPALPAPLDVRAPEQVLSVVLTDTTAYLGASPVADNLSSWAGGARRFAREMEQVSRSEFKLLEAFEVFGIDDADLAPRGQALDLGAAPGGWTRILRDRGQYVTAVDPAALDPRVTADSGVRYKAMTAETYLNSDPDQFDIIVNDMRMDGRDSARLMVAFARLLRPEGFAIMTLKLPEQDRAPILEQTFEILKRAYQITDARQLFHNRSEITLHLRPR